MSKTRTKSENITWHHGTVTSAARKERNGHRGATLWLTGLSGSGKSTLARALEARLFEEGVQTYVLDGDNVRHGLNRDLGFSSSDRTENIRRVSEVARLFVGAGMLCITAFISPYREDRAHARGVHEEGDFIEVYVRCELSKCEARDPKGLYKKARTGEIANFTGISAPYEAPVSADVVVDTGEQSVEESVETVVVALKRQGVL